MTELIKAIQGSEVVYRLGWTLVHSLWLGAAVGAAFAVAMVLLRRRSAGLRYLAGCAALVLMVAAPVGTFFAVRAPVLAPAHAVAPLPVSVAVALPEAPPSAPPAPMATSAEPPPEIAPLVPPRVAPLPGVHRAVHEKPAAIEEAPWTVRARQAMEPALLWVVLGWAAGVMGLSAWQLAGCIAASRLKRLATQPGSAALVGKLHRLARTLRVRRPVRLLESMLVRVPTVIGWVRPVLLLPVGLAAGLSPQQVEAILAHELAHIRRHDYLVNLVQALVETLLFFHPAVWFISRRVRAEREKCCDDVAVSAGAERFSYAETLIHVLRQSARGPRRFAPAFGAASLRATGKAAELRSRIVHLLGAGSTEAPRNWPAAAAVLAGVAIMAAVLVSVWAGPAASVKPAGRDPNSAPTQPADGAQARRIAALIEELGSTTYGGETAERQLVEIGWPAVLALREARQNRDAEVALRAKRAIEAIRRPKDILPGAFPLAVDRVSASSPAARKAQGPDANSTVAEMVAEFRTEPVLWKQAELVPQLVSRKDKTVLPSISEMLNAEDRGVRCNAAWILCGFGDDRGLAALLSELEDTGDRPTQRIRSDGKPDVLGQITSDRYYAAHVLGQVGDRRAVPALIAVLSDRTIDYQAAIALGQIGDPSAIPPLEEMLKTAKPSARLYAAYGLAKLGDPAGVPAVAEFLKDPVWAQRRLAVEALGKVRDARAAAALVEALKDESPEVRVSAAKALGEVGEEPSIPALEALLNDDAMPTNGPVIPVRQAALDAIERIRTAKKATPQPAAQPATGPGSGTATRVAELITQLGAEKVQDREAAQKALVRMGKPALEALRAAAKDKDPERAIRAEAIINQLRRESRFAIYLVTEPRFTGEAMKTALEDLELSADPAVCDQDIAAYDWDTHVMRLTPEGLARLPRMWGAYQPFVLVADGNRIYMGELYSGLNSEASKVPTITRSNAPGQPGMGNELRSSLGQAGAPDPRSDPRIRKALEAAGKLKAPATQPAAGEAVGGLKCSLSLKQTSLKIGDGIKVEVEFRNIADKPISFYYPPDYAAGLLTVRDANERAVSSTMTGISEGAMRNKPYRTLKPGEVFKASFDGQIALRSTRGAAALQRPTLTIDFRGDLMRFDLVDPGRFTVALRLLSNEQTLAQLEKLQAESPWKGALSSNAVDFQATAATREELDSAIATVQKGEIDPRRRAIHLLAAHVDGKATPALLDALLKGPEELKADAAAALQAIGDASVAGTVLAEYKKADSANQRQRLLGVLEACSDWAQQWPLYLEIAKSGATQDERDHAFDRLRMIGRPEVVPVLIAAAHGSDPIGQRAAIDRISELLEGKLPPETVATVTDDLISLLKGDSDATVRSRAAEALGRASGDKVLTALVAALKDADAFVGSYTAHSLGRIGGPEAIPALEQYVQAAPRDSQKDAGRKAIESIRVRGASSRPAAPSTSSRPAQPASAVEFGPAMEMVVRIPSAKGESYLDMESGKLLTYAEEANVPNEPALSREQSQIYRQTMWAKKSGADLCVPPDGRFDEGVTGLVGLDVRMVPTQEPFDRLTPQDVAKALADKSFYMHNQMRCREGNLPATFLVETGAGHVAVVQVVAVAARQAGLKVRYKIASVPVAIGPEAPLWITMAPAEEAVRSAKELAVLADVRSLDQEAGRTGELEIRSGDGARRVVRLPYPWTVKEEFWLPDGKRITGGTERKGRFTLDASQLGRVGELTKGDYLLAWNVGGKRCSNVMPFRIGEAADAKPLPLLELSEIETQFARGVPTLVLRARRHKAEDPAPLASQVAFPTLNIDGQDRTTEGFEWAGPDGPLIVGGHYTYLIDLRWYTWNSAFKRKEPPIDGNQPHVVFAKVGPDKVQQTAPIRLTFGRSVGEAWDVATAKLPPLPSPEASISLSGSVVDLQGKPGAKYEVSLSSEGGGSFREQADGTGKYQFRLVPPGTYKLGCNPPAMGQPGLAISGVVIEANKPATRDISLEGRFVLAGRATDAEGKPVPRMTIDLTCEDQKAGAEFSDTTETDEQGRYRLASPLGVVTYVGVSGQGGVGQKRINGAMPRLSPGESRVDFVADKGHFRAASATQPAGGDGSSETTQPARPPATRTAGELSATDVASLERLWGALADADQSAALQASIEMAAKGDQAVVFLRKKLSPVRAHDAAAVQGLIEKLDASGYAAREQAMAELSLIGIEVEEALHKAMESSKSVEARTRLDQLIKSAYSPVPLDPAACRWLRAVRALERLGSPGARALLGELAKGAPAARATQQAQEALRHLGQSAKTDSPTWWLARAEEEAEIVDTSHPFPYAMGQISCVLSDAGLTQAAAAMDRRTSGYIEARYHLAAAYVRAGQVKAAKELAASINFPDGRTEVNCRIGIALASIGWVEPNVAYTQPSADWIAATVAHPPDAEHADKWKVPEGLALSVEARIHAAIATAHAAAGRRALYSKNIEAAQTLIDKIPGDIAEMQRRMLSSDSSVAGAPGPDPMNAAYKTFAIEAVAMARARAGDYDGTRDVLKQLPAGMYRDARARLLAEDLAGRGELQEARKTTDAIGDKTHRNVALLAILGECLRTGDRAGAQAAADKIQADDRSGEGELQLRAYQTAAKLALSQQTGSDQDYQAAARYEVTVRWLARTQAQTPGRNREDAFRWIMTLPQAPIRFQALLGAAEGILATQAKTALVPAAGGG